MEEERSYDIVLLFPSGSKKLKDISTADTTFIRYDEQFYIVDKVNLGAKNYYENREEFPLHRETLKLIDNEMKPTEIPRALCKDEVDTIFLIIQRSEFKVSFKNHFSRCYPHEAASLSLGFIPNNVIHRDEYLRITDKEVEERTVVLCNGDSLWFRSYSNYHHPLCFHLEKLLKNPFFSIDEMLLELIKEIVLYWREDERKAFIKNYPYLASKLNVVNQQHENLPSETIEAIQSDAVLNGNNLLPTELGTDVTSKQEETEKLNTAPVAKKEFRKKDSMLMSYVKFHAKGETFASWLKMMIDSKYVFPDKGSYKPTEDNTDNLHENVKRVGLIKNGISKDGKEKYIVMYKVVLDKTKLSSVQEIAHRTVEDYFNEVRRE